MKRAARSIQPSLRRHRRPDRVPFSDHRHGTRVTLSDRSCNSNSQRSSFSSISFHDADAFNLGFRESERSTPPEKKQHNQPGRGQKQGGQRAQTAQHISSSRGNVFLPVFAGIHEAQDSMQDLLDRLVEIDHESTAAVDIATVRTLADTGLDAAFDVDYITWKKRTLIFREAGDLFDALVRSVNAGKLSPSRKHGKDLAQLAECLLFVCAQQHPNPQNDSDNMNNNNKDSLGADESIAAIKEVLKVLEVDWNLDVSHRHYEQAIAGACNWREWNLASDLFEKQIDPNAGGSPVRLSIKNPLALFAMTQRCQQHEALERENQNGRDETIHEALHHDHEDHSSMAAEHVMDAVQRLVMVSPQDQNTYVLAAGNALGHAGCWRELNDYRKSSFLSQQYGTPLVAATLRACLLCEEYEAALEILVEEDILYPSSNLDEEWQWGGARDRMDPLIRDLAMQVIGGFSAVNTADTDPTGSINNNEGSEIESPGHGYDSRLALELFQHSLDEGVTISQEALLGVVEACERDKDWRGAFSVLRTILEEEESNLENSDNSHKLAPWIVLSEGLSIAERDQIIIHASDSANDKLGARTVLPDLGPVLASIMRNCNSSSNFGLALFGLQLFRTQLLRSLPDGSFSSSSIINEDPLSPEEEIGEMLSKMNMTDSPQQFEELLIASMVALSGLRCNKNTMRLYEATTEDYGGKSGHAETYAASLMYQHASLNQKKHGTAVVGNSWRSAHNHIDQLTKASILIRRILREKSAESDDDAGAGNAGLRLQDRQREGTEEILARAMNSCTNAHQPELALYLLEWMEDSVFSQGDAQARFPNNHSSSNSNTHKTPIDANDAAGLYGDSVTAETILALRWTKDLDGAIEMFEGTLEKHAGDDLVRWRKTIVAGLTAMVASGRGSDAVKVFDVLDGDARSTDGYTTIGRHLSKVKNWKELIDLYRDAVAEGYNSEELSLLAMLAVTSTKVDNRLRILRAIVEDCATSTGLDRKRWTMANYWDIKKKLGFYHARLLMWWNDEQRAPLDEVNLAIKEFYNEKANGMRPKNDVVRAIITGASMHNHLGLERQSGYEKVPRSVDQWAELLEEILQTVKESSVRYDPNFVDSVVGAYKSLGRSKECVDYISDVLEVDGTRIRKRTLADAMEAAQVEKAFGLYTDIEMLLSSEPPRSRSNSADDHNRSSMQSLH